MKAPPLGKPPKRNERPNEIPKIHKMSETGRLKLEYERQMRTNEIVVTSAEPPRAKIEKSGYVKPRQRRRIPRLSPPCRRFNGMTRFESPLIKERIAGAMLANKTL